ncbi:MAG: hypothetical protein ACYC7D_14855 [Nitrososphaerales archaeon]
MRESFKLKSLSRKTALATIMAIMLAGVFLPSFSVQASQVVVNTVGNTTSFGALGTDYQVKTGYAASLYWVFYFDGTNIVYTSSNDGSIWASNNVVTSVASGQDFSAWFSGSTLYYVRVDESTHSFWYRYGTLMSSGSVSWSIPETSVSIQGAGFKPTITVDSNGNVWVAVQEGLGNEGIYMMPSGGSWTELKAGITVSDGLILPLSSGKVAFLYTSATHGTLNIITTSGGIWSTVSTTTNSNYGMPDAVAVGDNVYTVSTDSNDNIDFLTYSYGVGWDTQTVIASGLQSNSNAAISTDDSSTLVIFYGWGPTNNAVNFMATSTNLGASWGAPITVSNDQTYGFYLTAPYFIPNNRPYAIWNVVFVDPSVKLVTGLTTPVISSTSTSSSTSTTTATSTVTSSGSTSSSTTTSSSSTHSSSTSTVSTSSTSTTSGSTTSTTTSSTSSSSTTSTSSNPTTTVTIDPTSTVTVTQLASTVTQTTTVTQSPSLSTVTTTLTGPTTTVTSQLTTTSVTTVTSSVTQTSTQISVSSTTLTSTETISQLIGSTAYATCDHASINQNGNTNCQAYVITQDGGYPGGVITFSATPSGSGTFSNENCQISQQSNAYFVLNCNIQYKSTGSANPQIVTASYSGNAFYSPNSASFYLAVVAGGSSSTTDNGGGDNGNARLGGSASSSPGLSLLALIPNGSMPTVTAANFGSALAVAMVLGVPLTAMINARRKKSKHSQSDA